MRVYVDESTPGHLTELLQQYGAEVHFGQVGSYPYTTVYTSDISLIEGPNKNSINFLMMCITDKCFEHFLALANL